MKNETAEEVKRHLPGFYIELARRVVTLANSLQYDNAMNLLHLALSASLDDAPSELRQVFAAWGTVGSPTDGDYDHEAFDAGVNTIERWLAEQS